jgi:hypothetical protein
MPLVDRQQLSMQIAARQARWVPGSSWLDHLTDAQRIAMLGVRVNRAEVQQIRQRALAAGGGGSIAPGGANANATQPGGNDVAGGNAGGGQPNAPGVNPGATPAAGPGGPSGPGGMGPGDSALPPPQVDWRARSGQNFVSPVKNQGTCGSCVSFCACALVEAMAKIEHSATFPDLSEAELHFCSAHGPTCDGWWPSDALEVLRTRGVVSEAQFPYVSAFSAGAPTCVVVPNRIALATRIGTWSTKYTTADRKWWLHNVGPLCAVFHLYFDFFNYRAGVYSHVSGFEAGYHCAEVIGYSDPDGCWICKNSWGDTWGEGGFFRIAYGQCGIDDASTDTDSTGAPLNFPAWTVRDVIQAEVPPGM